MHAEAEDQPPRITASPIDANDSSGEVVADALVGARSAVHLTLFGRSWCHLCDDMKMALVSLVEGREFLLHEVDVDADPSLEDRFGERVPVLVTGAPDHAGMELCHYFLDAGRVLSWLDAVAAPTNSEGVAAISGKIAC